MNIFKIAGFTLLSILLLNALKGYAFKPTNKATIYYNKKDVFAGVAQVNITPALGSPLAGYTEERLSTAVHDSLWAKAIVLQQKKEKYAFVFCDLIEVSLPISAAARKEINQRTGIPIKNIIVAATHSHTGPEFRESRIKRYREEAIEKYGKYDEPKPYYPAFLTNKIVAAVVEANNKLIPVQLQIDVAQQQEEISFNRRYFMKDGSVRFNPGVLNPDIVKPAGPIDPEVGVLMMRNTSDKKMVCGLTVFAMHLDTKGGTEFSADYAYTLEQHLKNTYGSGFMSAFAAGTCGNINHINVKAEKSVSTVTNQERIGKALAQAIVSESSKFRTVTHADFKMLSKNIKVPGVQASITQVANAKASLAKLKLSRDSTNQNKIAELNKIIEAKGKHADILMEIQVFRFDKETAIVGLPGEVFVEHGLAIKKGSAFKNTIVMTLCNSKPSYIPDRKAYPQGSYEVNVAIVKPGGGEMMVETALKLLKKLK